MDREQIKQVLADHSLWLSSDGKQGKRADLHRANLTGADLTEADLYSSNLTGADLARVNLAAAELTGVRLTGAELGPQIRECYGLKGATVSEDQLAWLCLHPRFGEWQDILTIVPSHETEQVPLAGKQKEKDGSGKEK